MPDYQLKTPVVLLTFNRPDTTKKVFETIRQAKPPILLVSADGPRSDRPGEAEKCAAVRSIIDTIDWKCEVIKNYSDVNLGSYKRNSSSLNKFFNIVEEAIILEDDCLPHQSFFRFCEELLDVYREDKRVMIISGNNFQFDRKRTEYSYYFSRYTHIWGWATWRRSWQLVDLEMEQWSEFRDSGSLNNVFDNIFELYYWRNIFQNMYKGKRKLAWGYQLMLASFMHSGLSIIPEVNLVSNIGFAINATNTNNIKSPFANIQTQAIEFPLKHPGSIIRNKKADDFTYKNKFGYIARGTRKARQILGI